MFAKSLHSRHDVFPQHHYCSHPFFHWGRRLPNKINCRPCLWPLGKEFNYQSTKYWLFSEWAFAIFDSSQIEPPDTEPQIHFKMQNYSTFHMLHWIAQIETSGLLMTPRGHVKNSRFASSNSEFVWILSMHMQFLNYIRCNVDQLYWCWIN